MNQRVVSLVPSITENLIQFGLNPIARTVFCIEPKGVVREIPTVGGTKNPKIDEIVNLKPDLVIANQEENRKEDVEALQAKGLNVWVTYPRTVEETLSMMRELISRLQLDSKHLETVQGCENTFREIRQKALKKSPIVVTFIWKDPWMVAGGDTYINDMIKVAGGINPFESLGRYPQINKEDLFTIVPDVLLLPSEPYAFKEKDKIDWEMKFRLNGFSTQVDLFNGEDLCWFGPRVTQGLKNLNQLFTSLKFS